MAAVLLSPVGVGACSYITFAGIGILQISLVPRRRKDERVPGVYCTRMRVISTAKPRVWEGSARG